MFPYIHIILPSYTVMALIGGFASLCLVYSRLERHRIDFTFFLMMVVLCVIGGIIGSKVLFAITQIPWLIENFTLRNFLLLIPQSGFVFYGGLFGVIFTLSFLARKDSDLKKRIFKLCVPAMPLFHAFGRVGCFLAGCCYGKDFASPVVIGPVQLMRIPVQLMEAFAEIVLFVIVFIVDKKNVNADLLRIYLVTYAIIRFADEFLRDDDIRGIYFGISMAQWISISIILFYFIKAWEKKKKAA